MITCTYCGTSNSEGRSYCIQCGKPLTFEDKPIEPD